MSGTYLQAGETSLRRIVQAIRELFEGRSNAMGSFTVTENAGTTTVSHPNVGPESRIFFSPTSAAAATEFGAGTIHISSKALGSFVVTHVNSATAGRTFDYAIVG